MKRTILAAAVTAASLFATTAAQAAPSSGLLLGVYAFPNYRGLRVTDTMPGYSAHGRIFRNDVLTRVTTDGFTVYPTRNHWQIEYAKDQIGPNRMAALEVFRPGVGHIYFWVEFRPVGGAVYMRSLDGGAPQPVQKMEARILTEKERPGARALFQRGGQAGQPQTQPQPTPQPTPQPNPGFPSGGFPSDPGSLFGNR